jgi:arsenate reductase
MIIYGLKSCDTCRKARKALPEAVFVDVRDVALPEDVRDAALSTFGAALINTKSTTWRGLDAVDRALTTELLLAAHPAVMKRPLIVSKARMVLGWDRAAQAAMGVA